jgi:serine/threonine protein kinase
MASTQSTTLAGPCARLSEVRRHALRASETLERIEDEGLSAVLDRTLCSPSAFRALVDRIDERMSAGQVLKDVHESRSTYVARLSVEGRDIVAKRYNHKGLVHAFARTIQGSRARNSWCGSHILKHLGIGVPRPWAFFEIRRGPIVWSSYFLCEYVGAPSLYDTLERGQIGGEELANAARQVHEVLTSLARRRVTHGDLKLQNIVLGPDGAIIIDLDGIRFHRTALTYRLGRKKDQATFRRHIRRYPEFEAMCDALDR